jgi:hypothetical protein
VKTQRRESACANGRRALFQSRTVSLLSAVSEIYLTISNGLREPAAHLRAGDKGIYSDRGHHLLLPHQMYTKLIGTNNPGLFIILVDQSDSMSDSYADTNKADFAALAVNRTIYEILESCMSGEKPKDRCHISVIGYGKTTAMVLGGMPSEIREPVHGHKVYKKKIADGAGGLIEIEQSLPIYIQPTHGNGTPMAKAFDLANELVEAWTRDNPDNFPPIVFNITDGMPDDPAAAKKSAARLAAHGTADGKVLIFNCHIADSGGPEIKLPSSEASLTDENAKLLFQMSSEIPRPLFVQAQNSGLTPQEGSRGFGMNASPETFIKLLTFGSAMAR